MKKYSLPTLFSFVFVLSSFVSHAQAPAKGDTIQLAPEGRARLLTNKLSREVEMTKAQKDLIYLIYKDRSEKIDAIKADDGLSEGEKKQQIKAIKDNAEVELKEQLLAGQEEKYDAYKAEIKTLRQSEKQQNKLGEDAVDDLYESDI